MGAAVLPGRWRHLDGNNTNASNDPTVCPDPTLLCFPNLDGTVSNLTTTRGQTLPNSGALGFPNVLAEIDRTWTTTNSFGGTVQAATSERLFGHNNNLTIGLSVDRGLVQFGQRQSVSHRAGRGSLHRPAIG
jgi:iron complex outermembrane receptor protein